MDALHLLSWNVQGLGGQAFRRVKGLVRSDLGTSNIGTIDILFLQEHHLCRDRIQKYGSILPGRWTHFWVPAFGPNSRQAGLCIALRQHLQSIILSAGTVMNKRAQFLIIKIGSQKVGLMNIYAPNSASARASFWLSLVEYAGLADCWLVGGDFNMIEDASDRIGGTTTTISGGEAKCWDSFSFAFGLLDLWKVQSFSRIQGSLHFSRSDGSVVSATLSRLDRFYASSFFWDAGGSLGIIPGSTISDHDPLKLNVTFYKKRYSKQWRIPTSLLSDDSHRMSIVQIWSNYNWTDDCLILRNMVDAILDTKNFFINIVSASVYRYNSEIANLRRALAALQKLLERNPTSSMLLSDLQQVKRSLKEKQQAHSTFFFYRNVARWSQKQDRVNKEFFNQFKRKYKPVSITSLKRPDGSYTSDESEMRGIVSDYYHQLLSTTTFTTDSLYKKQDILATIQQKITNEMASHLIQPFTSQEVLFATKSLGKDVCPGKDGIGVVFYLHYWDFLGPILTRATNLIFSTGTMPTEWKEGIIYMIPKANMQYDEVSKWRPITLLNDIYKIVAKTIAIRLRSMLPSIIHDTQSGFVQDRSIFYNIFLFWEMVALAQQNKQQMAVLLLDFEKAYDKVEWDFLEAVLSRLGFPNAWINGVSALYRQASSSVLFAGGYGPMFPISRSVRQGCPLAPSLFILYGEALASYLRSSSAGIKGIALPIAQSVVLDVEFADDTALYVDGEIGNLGQVQNALQNFSEATGASLNWNKSVGVWVGATPHPDWYPGSTFRWLNQGEPIRYLGCLVGIDLKSEAMLSPLLLSIRHKLLYWDAQQLSFAGRVVVANSVLLASMWFIASVWLFSRSAIMKVQSLIRNFLWGGKNGSRTIAKVAWKVLIQPKIHGGLGLIDPLMQSRALLVKFVIRGLLPGSEAWKGMFLKQLMKLSPRTGGVWSPSLKWLFLNDVQTPRRDLASNRFLLGIIRAWDGIKSFLVKEKPSTWDAWLNQPLLGNSLFRDNVGKVLGLRTHLAWGKLDNGPAASVNTWIRFQQMPQADRLAHLQTLHGAKIMMAAISGSYSSLVATFEPIQEHFWFGCFINDILLAVKGISPNRCISYFEVLDNNRMQPHAFDCSYFQNVRNAPVRVIGKMGKKWLLDPYPSIAHTCDMMWLYAKEPVARLIWDPGGWFWTYSLGEQIIKVPFFQYSVKLGRSLLTSMNVMAPAAQKHWTNWGVSTLQLKTYWRWIWSFKGPSKFILFRWLLVHAALPVGQTLKGNVAQNLRQCGFCYATSETTKHALWSCPLAQQVWNKVLSLFLTINVGCLFSWGAAVWGILHSSLMLYEADDVQEAMTVHNRRLISVTPFQQPRKQMRSVQIWKTVTTITLWVLWKCRCSRLYDAAKFGIPEVLFEIWETLLTVVRGQYDNMSGSPENILKKRMKLLHLWRKVPLFVMTNQRPQWNYHLPWTLS